MHLSSKRAVGFRPKTCMSSTKPVSSVNSCVIFGWVTKVPLPRLTSTRPRSTKFWIAFRTVVRLTLNRLIKPSSGGNWLFGGMLPSAISPASTVSTSS